MGRHQRHRKERSNRTGCGCLFFLLFGWLIEALRHAGSLVGGTFGGGHSRGGGGGRSF